MCRDQQTARKESHRSRAGIYHAVKHITMTDRPHITSKLMAKELTYKAICNIYALRKKPTFYSLFKSTKIGLYE